jgi:hypothetical protein
VDHHFCSFLLFFYFSSSEVVPEMGEREAFSRGIEYIIFLSKQINMLQIPRKSFKMKNSLCANLTLQQFVLGALFYAIFFFFLFQRDGWRDFLDFLC